MSCLVGRIRPQVRFKGAHQEVQDPEVSHESHANRSSRCIWGLPKIIGTFLWVPIIMTIVCFGLCWDPLILGNHHLGVGILGRVGK